MTDRPRHPRSFHVVAKPIGSVTRANGFDQNWALDGLGNWSAFKEDTDGDGIWDINQTRTHNAVNELVTMSDHADPTYDAAGNMRVIHTNGALVGVYDAWNRLVKVGDRGGIVSQIEYDGQGRRIVRSVYDTTHDYYYNKDWQLLEEREDGDTDPLNQYVWHPYYVDALAMRWREEITFGVPTVTEHYFVQDANYNVTAALDDTGNVVERYSYTPYGEVTFLASNFSPLASSQIGNTHLYTGRELDAETGLQLNRNRYYASHLGRWINRDPIGYEGGLNLYAYVRNQPTYSTDPLGLQFWMPEIDPRKGVCGECPDEKEYDKAMQCCENGSVVGKVPIWVCNAPLGNDDTGWKIGPLSHSYIVCEDPVANPWTDEKYGFHPYPFSDDRWGTHGPGYVNREINRDPNHPRTTCERKLVCPEQKEEMCQEGSPGPCQLGTSYMVVGPGTNCHEWANQ